jgi:hypothetical protein
MFGHTFRPNLVLDREGRVLVGFTAREGVELATRDHPARLFHIVRLNLQGQSDLSLFLPTNDWHKNGLYLGPDDQIFGRAGDAFEWLSADGSRGNPPAWQVLAACPESCSVWQSFSRKTLLLRSLDEETHHTIFKIVDAASSTPRVTQTCAQFASIKITDRFAYVPSYDKDDHLVVRFGFCEMDHYEEVRGWGRGAGYVLNDETFLKIGPAGTTLIGLDGHVRFSREPRKHEWIDPDKIATNERYDRFAFMVNTVQGEHPHLDVSGHLVARHILVLDQAGKELASIPTDSDYHPDSNFAMSPDGHHLAILEEGVVTIVELP